MARYRKIDVRIWSDGKFRDLTPIPPCGQGLWLYLLTSPYTTNIPGLYRASEGALADDLHWPLKAFRKAFLEAFQQDMVKADWTAPLVWVKNALRYNQPESPNVVKSWRSTWDEIPEVYLKVQAYQSLKAFTEGLGEAFGKAFAEGCRRPPGVDPDHPSPNQEQEQEQEQDQEREKRAHVPRALLLSEFEQFWTHWPDEKIGKGKAEEKFLAARRKGVALQTMLDALVRETAARASKAERGD